MSDEQIKRDRLELDVNEAMAALGESLDAAPAAAVVERVKAVVRCEIDEVWLAEQPTPEPDPAVLGRVRSAVRRELTLGSGTAARAAESLSPEPESPPAGRRCHTEHSPAGRRCHTWPQGIASLAAAAMLAVCVGVIRQVSLSRPDAGEPGAPAAWAADERVELFVHAADDVLAGDEFTNSILSELGAIEDRMGGWRTTSSDSERSILDFERTLDELLRDADTSEDPVGLGGRGEDGLG